MKRLLYLILILLASCGQTMNKEQEQVSLVGGEKTETIEKPIDEKAITFQELKGKAILIGDNIDILNNKLQKITTFKKSSIVELEGLSNRLFQKTDDYCDAFHYVKIRTDSENGIIDGRNVYQLVGSQQDTTFHYQDKKFDLKTTSFFGIGESDEDGLTFCSKYHEPVVLIESESNQPKLIELIKNDISEKASWNSDFQYFELMANDGAYDKIQKIEQTDNGIVLTINREFQEGWNEYQVKLNLSADDYKIEYLNYGEIKY